MEPAIELSDAQQIVNYSMRSGSVFIMMACTTTSSQLTAQLIKLSKITEKGFCKKR